MTAAMKALGVTIFISSLPERLTSRNYLGGRCTVLLRDFRPWLDSVSQGWLALGERNEAWAIPAVTEHLDQGGAYSYFAVAGMCVSLQRQSDRPDAARALLELATRGTPDERSTAMGNAQLMPEDLARGLFDTGVDAVEEVLRRNPSVRAGKPFGDDRLYSSLLGATIDILHARHATSPWVREELLSTFDREGLNLWQGGSPFSPDLGFGNREVLEWVVETLGEEDYARLKELRRIPGDLARVHDEMRKKR
jgi:hypothetical protein